MYPGGLRHIRPDRRINEWKVPGRRTIRVATSNDKQVAIGLQNGEMYVFELDLASGLLQEYDKCDMQEEVASLDLAPVLPGRQRCPFLAVGLYNNIVRILGLEPHQNLKQLALQVRCCGLPVSASMC